MQDFIRKMVFANFRLSGFLLHHLSPELGLVKIHLEGSVSNIESQSLMAVESERSARNELIKLIGQCN